MIPADVFAAYGLQPERMTVEPLGNGLINTTWKLTGEKGVFVLQKINAEVFKNPGAIASNLALIGEYLKKNHPGYLFVGPLPTVSGEEMATVENGSFRLLPFVQDSHTISTVEKPEQAFEAAKKFGEFSRLLSDFPVDQLQLTLPDFHNLTLRYRQFTAALEQGNQLRRAESAALIQSMMAQKGIVDDYQRILKNPSFRVRVIHHDTKISNVLFDRRDKGLCVIDLDTVMPGYFISDVGDMMRTYLSPVNEEDSDYSRIEIREDYFRAIWVGYMEEMNGELHPEEKKHFIYAGKFMIFMQALRFLSDHLNNDAYYGASYEGQNFVRASNQMVLLKQLLEKEAALRQIIGQ